jgi:hypothetical protein
MVDVIIYLEVLDALVIWALHCQRMKRLVKVGVVIV